MKLKELTEDEYKSFAYKHPLFSFHQSIAMTKIKAGNGWKSVLLGLIENNQVKAAASFIYKDIIFGKKIYYAPHGYLIDYEDHELVKLMTEEVKDYVKNHGGFFFKIDPYLMKKRRDKEGKIVEDDIDNTKHYNYLKEIGFNEVASGPNGNTLQLKWLYIINLEDKTEKDIQKDMAINTRNLIRKNERNGVYTEKHEIDSIDVFYDIMENTSNRRAFGIRDKSYYKDMLEKLSEENMMELHIAHINLKEEIDKLAKELKDLKEEVETSEKDFEAGKLQVNAKKFKIRMDEKKAQIKKLPKNIAHYEKLRETDGDILNLSAILAIKSHTEIIAFVGGTKEKYLEFQPFYTLNYNFIKEALNLKLKRFNFYGIPSNLSKDNPDYGVYAFKKDFGGEVVELIGEFDYPLNKPLYYSYLLAFKLYRLLIKLKNKFKHIFYKIKKEN